MHHRSWLPILLLTVVIILGSTIVGCQGVPSRNEPGRYTMHVSGSNLIIFDTVTGKYWRKYLAPNEAPTEWQAETIPGLGE